MRRAIAIIADEHRALGAVLHGLNHVCAETLARGAPADFELLWAMLTYIDRFPERLHHPKEDRHLFRLLRLRAPEAEPVLRRLERDHRQGPRLIGKLRQALQRWQDRPGEGPAKEFLRLVEQYCEFHWRHMRAEEEEILPLAVRKFAAEDWAVVDAAFAANDDPLVGVDSKQSFDLLLRRIVNMAPPPYGLGAEPDPSARR